MTAPARDPLASLGNEVADALVEASAHDLARQRERLLSVVDRAPRRAWRAPVLAASFAAVAVCGVAGYNLRERSRTHASPSAITASAQGRTLDAGAWVAAPETSPLEVRFSDGSRLTLAAGAHARVVELNARGARVLLERGRSEVSIAHRERAHWSFAAGPYTVAVTGTSFSLGWDPSAQHFDLAMHAGRVVLRGPRCDEGLALKDTEEAHADVSARTLVVGAEPSLADVREPSPPRAPSPVPGEGGAGANEPPGERPATAVRAVSARHVAARPVASPARSAHLPPPSPGTGEGVRGGEGPALTAPSLFEQADRARHAGDVFRAREMLMTLRRESPRAPDAARAAFVLGVMALESLRTPAEAARWFELYLREAPDGSLASESRGRLVHAYHALGDRSRARDAAERYLAHDPRGPFAEFARSALTP